MDVPSRACAVCGAPCPAPFRAPAAELAPDLDGRPGEPARSTLPRWIATCQKCGAAAPDLTALPNAAAEGVRSDAYGQTKGAFQRWALLCERAGDREGAAKALLEAAWALDDAGKDAAPLRLAAAGLWGEGDPLRLIDVLRRARAFERAGALAAAQASSGGLDEDAAGIVAFQMARIQAGDAGRYMISSALRPPARTPHAAHGRAAGRGFWARLFGR